MGRTQTYDSHIANSAKENPLTHFRLCSKNQYNVAQNLLETEGTLHLLMLEGPIVGSVFRSSWFINSPTIIY